MKINRVTDRWIIRPVIAGAAVFLFVCEKESNENINVQTAAFQTNLTSDTAAFAGARIDANLSNSWGMDFDNNGTIYIASNHAGVIVAYDSSGQSLAPAITVPGRIPGAAGSPSGLDVNTTGSFIVPNTGAPAKVIAVTEDGLVVAWNSGTVAAIVDSGDSGAVYKGVAIAASNGKNFIYAANFRERRVDVYDSGFSLDTTKKFSDPSIPADFGPFNVSLIDGNLFVAYAKLKPPDFMDDNAGPGNGYIDVFRTDGSLKQRFAAKGALNSPWGMARSGSGCGTFSDAILIGNFGDGKINVFDDESGRWKGSLLDSNGNAVAIDGLWAIKFPPPGTPFSASTKNLLYFTAGPADENHGLFGVINFKQVRTTRTGGFGY